MNEKELICAYVNDILDVIEKYKEQLNVGVIAGLLIKLGTGIGLECCDTIDQARQHVEKSIRLALKEYMEKQTDEGY